jgi:hypothetical protein
VNWSISLLFFTNPEVQTDFLTALKQVHRVSLCPGVTSTKLMILESSWKLSAISICLVSSLA